MEGRRFTLPSLKREVRDMKEGADAPKQNAGS